MLGLLSLLLSLGGSAVAIVVSTSVLVGVVGVVLGATVVVLTLAAGARARR